MKVFFKILLFFPFLVNAQVSILQSAKQFVLVQPQKIDTSDDFKNSFTFNLVTAATTSAGVFAIANNLVGKKDTTLVRTLWGNVQYGAGKHISSWDGLTDDGVLAPKGSYIVKVLTNNVKYNWDGVIGNTSASATGPNIHHAFEGMYDMAIVGNNMYYVTGYNEVNESITKVSLFNVQVNLTGTNKVPFHQSTTFIATDGTTMYLGGHDGWDNYHSFVYAITESTGKEVSFTDGVPVKINSGLTYASSIDTMFREPVANSGDAGWAAATASVSITGMAVQKVGDYLFVARKWANRIDVVDKKTGQLVRVISMTSPKGLVVDQDDKLWVVSGTSVEKYIVNGNGTLTSTGITLSGLVAPISVSVSPDNNIVVLTDGGTSQQVKAFNNNTGVSLWTLGQLGGYVTNPDVTDDRFFFERTVGNYIGLTAASEWKAFVAFQPDGSFWVGDGGTSRALHYTVSRTYIEQIMYMPHSYCASVHPTQPTRVFDRFYEFEIDYSKPLSVNNNSWTLKKNWLPAASLFQFNETYYVFKNIRTLSNGKTYATVQSTAANDIVIVELPATGIIRTTGVKFTINDGEHYYMQKDGSLITEYGKLQHQRQYWVKRTLMNFDASNNPVYSTPVTIADLGTVIGSDPVAQTTSYITPSGKLMVFNTRAGEKDGKTGYGYHFGAIDLSTNKWSWKTSYATTKDYTGDYPTDGAFDIGNGVRYAGGDIAGVDSFVTWSYHGEFYKGSQTNKYSFFHENGLMIGEFGTLNGGRPYADSGVAGNVLQFNIVEYGNDYYLYHADEFTHQALHRWKISNLNSIAIQNINFTDSNTPVKLGLDVLSSLPKYKNNITNTSTLTIDHAQDNNFYLSSNIKKYDRFTSPDLYMYYSKPATNNYNVTLLINSTQTSAWTVKGDIILFAATFDGNQGTNVELLDNDGKIISRMIYWARGTNDRAIRVNGVDIITGQRALDKIVSDLKPFSISYNGSVITFMYNGSTIITPIFDNTANYNRPTFIRINPFTNNQVSSAANIIDLQNLFFISTE